MKQILLLLSLTIILSCSSRYTVTDFSGRTVAVDDVSVGDKNQLFSLLGGTEVIIPLSSVKSLSINAANKKVYNGKVLYQADIVFIEGKTPNGSTATPAKEGGSELIIETFIEVSTILKGTTDVGQIKLPLKSVRTIKVFEDVAPKKTVPPAEVDSAATDMRKSKTTAAVNEPASETPESQN